MESLLGAAAAIFALFLVKVIFIDRLRDEIRFFPLIQNHDVLAIAPWILIAATVIAVDRRHDRDAPLPRRLRPR